MTASDTTSVPAHLHGSRAAIFHLLRASAGPVKDRKTESGEGTVAETPNALYQAVRQTAAAAEKARRPARRKTLPVVPLAQAEASTEAPVHGDSPAGPVRGASWACLIEEDCFQFRSVAERRASVSL